MKDGDVTGNIRFDINIECGGVKEYLITSEIQVSLLISVIRERGDRGRVRERKSGEKTV